MNTVSVQVRVAVKDDKNHRSVLLSSNVEDFYWDKQKNEIRLPRVKVQLPESWKEDCDESNKTL